MLLKTKEVRPPTLVRRGVSMSSKLGNMGKYEKLVSAHMGFQMAFLFWDREASLMVVVRAVYSKPLAHQEGVVSWAVIGEVIDGRCYTLTFVTSGK